MIHGSELGPHYILAYVFGGGGPFQKALSQAWLRLKLSKSLHVCRMFIYFLYWPSTAPTYHLRQTIF